MRAKSTKDDALYVNEFVAAEKLGLSVHTLRGLRRDKKGPKYTKFGSAVRYRMSWLDAWAELNAVDPRAA